MKKILLFFIVFYSLSVNSQLLETGYETRNLGQSLTEAQALLCSGNVINSGRRGRFNVLSESKSPLQVNKLYKLDEDGEFRYYYIIKKNSSFRDRDSYFDNRFTLLNTVVCDRDNDGVSDDQDNCPSTSNSNQLNSDNDSIGNVCDNCPNQAGPSSNNGCPIPQGKPDFKVTAISINAGGVTTSTNTSSYLNLRSNQNHKFCVTVKNIGNNTGNLNNVSFVLSNGVSLLASSIIANLPAPSAGTVTIAPNETKEYCVELYIWDNYLGYSLPSFNYIHTDVDYYNNTDESNETNNKAHASVSYSSSRNPITLIINDTNGNLVNKTIINNKEEEFLLIKGLNKGLYFINKDGKKSQIYKLN